MKKKSTPAKKSPAIRSLAKKVMADAKKPKLPPPPPKNWTPPPIPPPPRSVVVNPNVAFDKVVGDEKVAARRLYDYPEPPGGTTHLLFLYRDQHQSLVGSIKTLADFGSLPGYISYGTFRDYQSKRSSFPGGDFIPLPGQPTLEELEEQKRAHFGGKVPRPGQQTAPKLPPPPGAKNARGLPPPPPARNGAARPPAAPGKPVVSRKREGVCAFIDDLIEKGGKTKTQILAAVLRQFPGRDPKGTLSTINVRPTHMRAAGRKPQPFAG